MTEKDFPEMTPETPPEMTLETPPEMVPETPPEITIETPPEGDTGPLSKGKRKRKRKEPKEGRKLNPFARFRRNLATSIVTRLSLNFISVGVVPLIITAVLLGVIAFTQSRNALVDETFNKLDALRVSKAGQITRYLEEREGDMHVLLNTTEAMEEEAVDKLLAVLEIKEGAIETYFADRVSDAIHLSSLSVSTGSEGVNEGLPGQRLSGLSLCN